jgi:double-stranded uracil-DNA glycosylase
MMSLAKGLKVVFVEMAAGIVSAQRREYYAHLRNRFWKTLFTLGLTPRCYSSSEFRCFAALGFGLTDLCQTQAGMDCAIKEWDVAAFEKQILSAKPPVIVFNGKKAGLIWLRHYSLKWSGYGIVLSRLPEFPVIFILPSTSGANRHWGIEPWKQLSRFLK